MKPGTRTVGPSQDDQHEEALMAAVRRTPTLVRRRAGLAPVPLPVRVSAVPAAPPSRTPPPALAVAAAGSVAMMRLTGAGLLGATDAVAYATLERAEQAVAGDHPLSLLTVAPAALARLAYQASSDAAHGLLGEAASAARRAPSGP